VRQALLSEHITDCDVQLLSGEGREAAAQDPAEDDDFSHMNYRQAATMMQETKNTLLQWLRDALGGAVAAGRTRPAEGPHEDAGDDPADLRRQANLSLARIFLKQGRVYAKVDNHALALVREWSWPRASVRKVPSISTFLFFCFLVRIRTRPRSP
jgi:hypothetical protein